MRLLLFLLLLAAGDCLAQAPQQHKVQKGETLYRISVNHGVSVAQLQAWNNLSDNQVREGQVLIIKKTGAPAPSTEPSKGGSNPELPEAMPSAGASRVWGARIYMPSGSSTQMLGLHKKETIGSRLRITNPDNGRSVVIKVIGALPDYEMHRGIAVKLAPAVCDRIGLVGPEFRLQVQMLP